MKPNRNLPYRDRVRNEPTTNSKTTRPAGYLPPHLSVSFSVPPFSLAASPLYLRKSSTFPSASQYKAAFIVNNAAYLSSVFSAYFEMQFMHRQFLNFFRRSLRVSSVNLKLVHQQPASEAPQVNSFPQDSQTVAARISGRIMPRMFFRFIGDEFSRCGFAAF